MKHAITAAPASSAPREDGMPRRDFLKTAAAAAVLAAILPVRAKEALATSDGHFADVDGQHISCSAHGAGKPLVLLHGGVDPDSFGGDPAELAKGRQVIAPDLQARRDAGINGSLRPANQLAIVPDSTHYTIPVDPMLPEIVERFPGAASRVAG